MAANIQAINREFTPGLRVHLSDMAEIDRLEAVMGAAVVPEPNLRFVDPAKWDGRTKLTDRLREGAGPAYLHRQIGNMVATVISSPLPALYGAIENKTIKRTKEKSLVQPVSIERDPDLVSVMAYHCVGMALDGDLLSITRNPIGHFSTNVWYVPRLPAQRTKQDKKQDVALSSSELLERATPTIQLTPVRFRPFSRVEAADRMRQLDGSPSLIPRIKLNDVVARAESNTEIPLTIGDVVRFPVAPRADSIDTQWGPDHVVTGINAGDELFLAGQVLSVSDRSMLDAPNSHTLPAEKTGALPWSIHSIVEAMHRINHGVDRGGMGVYLGRQAVDIGEVAYHLPPLGA